MHILFGYVLGISNIDAFQVGGLALLISGLLLALRRSLLVYAFDPAHAHAIRLRVPLYHYLLLAVLALTVVASVQTVGIVLVVAMLITPGAIAHLLTDKFDHMLAIAVGVSVFACVVGAYSSYYFDVSTGGAMVLVLGALFAVAFIAAPRYGLLAGRYRAKKA